MNHIPSFMRGAATVLFVWAVLSLTALIPSWPVIVLIAGLCAMIDLCWPKRRWRVRRTRK